MIKANVMKFPQNSPYTPCEADGVYTACKLPKDVPAWLGEGRMKAFARFQAQGLPTQKLERFKYTNIAKAVSGWDGISSASNISAPDDLVSNPVDNPDVDEWIKDLLLAEPAGLEKYGDTALWDLNTAYLRDVRLVDIPAGKIVDTPLTLDYTGVDDTFTSPRVIIRIGDNASLILVENFKGQGEYWRNGVTQIILGKNARLEHVILNKDSAQAVATQFTHISLARDAHYNGFALNIGGGVFRHQIQSDLEGTGGHVSFNGLNLLSGTQHGDTTILVNHRAAHCQSNQFYRSLLDGAAHGVFQGKVHVYEGAQKTDGYQLSNTILLSEKAVMDTKPELEIYADDVKCSHGATTGQLDEEPLFYLRSRGLNEKQARLLLIQAFVDEVVGKIADENLQEMCGEDIAQWLENAL